MIEQTRGLRAGAGRGRPGRAAARHRTRPHGTESFPVRAAPAGDWGAVLSTAYRSGVPMTQFRLLGPIEVVRAPAGIARCAERFGETEFAVARLGKALPVFCRIGAAEADSTAALLADWQGRYSAAPEG